MTVYMQPWLSADRVVFALRLCADRDPKNVDYTASLVYSFSFSGFLTPSPHRSWSITNNAALTPGAYSPHRLHIVYVCQTNRPVCAYIRNGK